MEINRVTRKIRLDDRHTTIKYQLITELVFLRKINIIDSDLSYLALLIEWGPTPLKDFCNKAVSYLYADENAEKYPHRIQAVRNRVGMLEKRNLILKNGKGKKMIAINPSISIESEGNILLEYNFLYVETKESQRPNTRVIETAAAL
jgi:hypothetical protein